MCEAWDEMKKDCKAEGMQEERKTIAKNLLQMDKLSHEDIAISSGLPLDTVLALAQEVRSAYNLICSETASGSAEPEAVVCRWSNFNTLFVFPTAYHLA